VIDFSQLDKTIHEKGRLAIMSLLSVQPEWPFQDLKSTLHMSDGNLITHLRTLEKVGYVTSNQTKEGVSRPQTKYALTPEGRTAYRKYLAVLEDIVKQGGGAT
jgi:DNA-binding HxlR family transcriptional regulator